MESKPGHLRLQESEEARETSFFSYASWELRPWPQGPLLATPAGVELLTLVVPVLV